MSPDSTQAVARILEQAEKVTEPAVQVFCIKVTPEIAPELLQANDNIRSITKAVVGRYKDDMRVGLWSFTGSPLVIDWDGKLRDGQHRLQACIDSGEPFDTVVVLGVDPVSSLNLDTGAKRGLHNFLRNEGHDDPKNLAAAIRLSYQLLDRKVVTQETFSNETLMHWFRDDQHQGLIADLKRVRLWEKDLRDMGTGLTRTYLAAIRHAASYVPGLDVEDVDAFYSQLAGSRHIINRRAPEYQLRVFLQRATTVTTGSGKEGKQKNRIQQPERIAVTINALNLFIAGREAPSVSAITWNPGGKDREPFPQISAGPMVEIAAELEAAEGENGGGA